MIMLRPITTLRSADDGPWFWGSKNARNMIREGMDGSGAICSALSVYDALCEIASDHQAEEFKTTHAYIGLKSGTAPATVKRCLAEFAAIGLVEVTPQRGIRGPCAYRLLRASAHGELTIAQDKPTMAHSDPTLAQIAKRTKRATLEESKKNTEESEKKVTPQRFSPPNKTEWLEYARGLEPWATDDVLRLFNYYESVGWVVGQGRKPMKNWRAAAENGRNSWFQKQAATVKSETVRLGSNLKEHVA